MVISREGTLIRTSVSDISVLSRATQGVKVMRSMREIPSSTPHDLLMKTTIKDHLLQ